ARKLALYTQDDDRNVTKRFTLTAPSLTVESENARIQNGTFKGDVHVEANNFQLPGGTIDGDLIFASEEYQESAQLEEGEITGEVRVEAGEESADATTGATQSVIASSDDLEEGMSSEGGWIVIFEGDVESDEELTLEGGVENNDGEIARKLALYTQDDDRNVTKRYTLTAPMLTVESENARIQNGTFKGDVHVNANNFQLPGGTIDGDLTFASEELQESAQLEEGEVTGEISVEE
ncbi:MAG: polymer-forming cytoskeletal protein, partial [Alkalibacterium gilvum]|uniref:polymer-forming cytoskeletal protein n=1 Tax=Alkalibacterium gilvum TaxID=1130080 RepID=UPI003F93B1BF